MENHRGFRAKPVAQATPQAATSRDQSRLVEAMGCLEWEWSEGLMV